MEIAKIWASQWFKILLITLGIIMVICAIYSFATSSPFGLVCLIVMGIVVSGFGIALFLWHHNAKFKEGVQSRYKSFTDSFTSSDVAPRSDSSPRTGSVAAEGEGDETAGGGYYYL